MVSYGGSSSNNLGVGATYEHYKVLLIVANSIKMFVTGNYKIKCCLSPSSIILNNLPQIFTEKWSLAIKFKRCFNEVN